MCAMGDADAPDLLCGGKGQARCILREVDGKVVFAAKLILRDAAARHGGKHSFPHGRKAQLRIVRCLWVEENVRLPAV